MTLSLILALLSCVCGAAGACYWYRSAMVEAIPTWADASDNPDFTNVPMIDLLGRDGWISRAIKALTESSRLNKWAALWSAAAVILTALSSVSSALGY